MEQSFSIKGNLVDVIHRKIFPAVISVREGRIASVEPSNDPDVKLFLLPGLVDAHVHVESSMLIPSEFARLAVVHGTVATVSDPHEIANVLGIKGIEYMLHSAAQVPFHFHFGAPSCVPATNFETAGAVIDSASITKLLARKEIGYLSEMMNYPGVLHGDPEVMRKIEAAIKVNKPIDGHAPGLKGADAQKYISAGMDPGASLPVIISTDHECFTYEEGLFKLQNGMKILIREGSAAKNFEALIPLLDQFPEMVMFCSDDKHPNDLVRGHINQLIKRALGKGIDFWKVIRAATYNPVSHYHLECGLLRENDSADFIVADDLKNFNVIKTFVKGQLVAENGKSLIPHIDTNIMNNFHSWQLSPEDFKVATRGKHIRVIEALDGQLITREQMTEAKIENGFAVSDIDNDVLKFTVVNRYTTEKPAVAFIKNFGLKKGAIASNVGHDSHNILAVGVSDEMICKAINLIMQSKGGLAAVDENNEMILPLPVAGIMTNDDGYKVATGYEKIDTMAKQMGSTLTAPFMTLSFMALLVIPQLKLSDKGLFDGTKFEFVPLFV